MRRLQSTTARPLAVLALGLAVVAAACSTGAGASPTPAPATPAPTQQPSASPSEMPPLAPAEGVIDLDIADGHDVSVVVVDAGGALTGATSGRAGDGMSVRWGDAKVVNVDEDTLRLTWVGLPVDAEIALEISAKGEGYVLAFTQPAPPAYSDAIGFDRVLVLDFENPVRAGDIETVFSTAA